MVDNLILPPDRSGDAFAENSTYVASAKLEARRLVSKCNMKPDDRLLDIGCGYGKLATGILRAGFDVNYTGIDVRKGAIRWCQGNLAPLGAERFRFVHIDAKNERYNPAGSILIDDTFKLPFGDQSFDLAYAFSVFSHIRPATAGVYSREIARILKPGGMMFLTAFTRSRGPRFAENPDDFDTILSRNTPLHFCVYQQRYFEHLVTRSGLEKVGRRRKLPGSTQSTYYLRRAHHNISIF